LYSNCADRSSRSFVSRIHDWGVGAFNVAQQQQQLSAPGAADCSASK
jgi:hypothetical protein